MLVYPFGVNVPSTALRFLAARLRNTAVLSAPDGGV
jgi:hypothetical protein